MVTVMGMVMVTMMVMVIVIVRVLQSDGYGVTE
jgi:hypothetical protein